jgi:deoxyribose-phosphate aldolase
MNKLELAKYIDHTNLKPNLSRNDVLGLIEDCKKYKFAAICITPGWVSLAKQKLAGTGVEIATVPNWQSGGGLKRVKGDFVFAEADAIDYIWDLHRFCIQKDWANTAKELDMIRKATKKEMKVIIESTVIRAVAEEKKESYEMLMKEACKLVEASGANFIKTDSGLFVRNPNKRVDNLYEDVGLMKQFCKLPIKASAGIRDLETVKVLIKIGATRIGTSAGVKIVEEVKDEVVI